MHFPFALVPGAGAARGGASAPAAEPVVRLKGGLVVPLAALRLLWALEDRGVRLASVGDRLWVPPGSTLSAAETAALRRHRDHLLALVQYDPAAVK